MFPVPVGSKLASLRSAAPRVRLLTAANAKVIIRRGGKRTLSLPLENAQIVATAARFRNVPAK
jgi:hypothetical protein